MKRWSDPKFVILANRNLTLRLPTGHVLLIAYAEHVVGLHWFDGRLTNDPYRTVHLNVEDYPHLKYLFYMGAWDIMLVLDLAWQYGRERGVE